MNGNMAPGQTPAAVTKDPMEQSVPTAAGNPNAAGKKKIGMILLAIGVLVFAFLVIGSAKLLLTSEKSPLDVILYRNTENELALLTSLKKDAEPTELADDGHYYGDVRLSPDGKTLYYVLYADEEELYPNTHYFPDRAEPSRFYTNSAGERVNGTLYKVSMSDLKKGAQPERVSRSVGLYQVLDNGWLLLSAQDGGLSFYDGDQTIRISKNADGGFDWDKNSTVFFLESDGDSYSFYKMEASRDAQKVKLAKGLQEWYTRLADPTVVYGIHKGEDGVNNLAVYACSGGKEAVKLVDGVASVRDVTVKGGKVDFYYTIQNTDTYTYYDFVLDGKEQEDQASLKASFPSIDWQRIMITEAVETDQIWYDENWQKWNGQWVFAPLYGHYWQVAWNGVQDNEKMMELYALPLDVELIRQCAAKGEYPHQYDYALDELAYAVSTDDRANFAGWMLDLFVESDRWSYETTPLLTDYLQALYDQKGYTEIIKAWEAAQVRQCFREALREETGTRTFYELYHYAGKVAEQPVATHVQNLRGAGGIYLYQKAGNAANKAAELGAVGTTYETVEEWLYYAQESNDYAKYMARVDEYQGIKAEIEAAAAGSGDWYQCVSDKESEIELDAKTNVESVYTLNGKEAVLCLNVDGIRVMDAYTIGKEAITYTSTVVDGSYSGGWKPKDSEAIYFYTDVEYDDYGASGDLYVYRGGGKAERLVSEVNTTYMLPGGGLYTVAEQSKDAGTLCAIRDGKSLRIDDEYYGGIEFLDEKRVIYMADGDLYFWNGEERKRIAWDVEEFWLPSAESYKVFFAY